MIKTKWVYSPIRKRDGLRILATRFRGRGLKKNRYQVWMANLGPSEKLLRDAQSQKISWAEFNRKYKSELFETGSIDKCNKTIKNRGQKFTLRLLNAIAKHRTVTLMCHCENETHCHRRILRQILESMQKSNDGGFSSRNPKPMRRRCLKNYG